MTSTSTSSTRELDSWQLDPAVRFHLSDSGSLLIRSGDLVHRITDTTAVGLLCSALRESDDGTLRLPADADAAAFLTRLLDQLVGLGVVGAGEADEDHRLSATLLYEYRRRTHGQLTQEQLATRVRDSPVYVAGTGQLADQIREGLLASGVPSTPGPPSGSTSLTILVTEGMRAHDVTRWNESRLSEDDASPWLLVEPFDGSRAFIGPLIFPRQTACQECFRLRRVSAFPDDTVSAELVGAEDVTPPTLGAYPAITRMQAGVVIEVVLDHVVLGVSGPSSRPGSVKVLRADGRGLSMSDQRVLKVPRCPHCSLGRGTGRPQTWFPYNGAPMGSA